MLGAKSGSGLRVALETPSRIDELFVERATQPVAERLHLLAGEEQFTEQLKYAPQGAQALLDALRRRYNFVVSDLPYSGQSVHLDMLHLAQQRVLVMTPTLAGVRDALRLLALPNGPAQPRRAVVVLNRVGMPGGLDTRRIADALKMQPDIVIADGKASIERAASAGRPAIQGNPSFRACIEALAREVGFSGGNGKPLGRRLFKWRT